ncbi:MAG: retroviral-like aspartic protease family protein [Tepidiformaceae bacterium]
MGMTHVDIVVANPSAPDAGEKIRFLVDSGATYSVVPGEVLGRLGIRPLTEQVFKLANGDKVARKQGGAIFRYRGRAGGAGVVFGEPGDCNLLGALTLGALGLSLDPLKRELNELPMLL